MATFTKNLLSVTPILPNKEVDYIPLNSVEIRRDLTGAMHSFIKSEQKGVNGEGKFKIKFTVDLRSEQIDDFLVLISDDGIELEVDGETWFGNVINNAVITDILKHKSLVPIDFEGYTI